MTNPPMNPEAPLPLISIVIPCFNACELLADMLDCILAQTYPHWELLLVDDGSTDGTADVIKGYQRRDNRIHLIVRNRPPKGSTTCRNIGYEQSRGKYVMHLDADDLLSPTCFEHRVAFMERHPDADYASFPVKGFSDPQHLPVYSVKGRTWGAANPYNDLLTSFLRADYPFSVWCNIYRRDAIDGLRWDENVKIYTDFSYITTGILMGLRHQFSQSTQVDYYYRITIRDNMCSTFTSSEKTTSTIYLFTKTLDALKLTPAYGKYKRAFLGLGLLHYERLLTGASEADVNAYLQFMATYYAFPIVLALRSIACVVLSIAAPGARKRAAYVLLGLCFQQRLLAERLWCHFQQRIDSRCKVKS